jgi:hypothetical protein
MQQINQFISRTAAMMAMNWLALNIPMMQLAGCAALAHTMSILALE